MRQRALLLHNIRSSHNVGSMFRTADAAGVHEIILSGYTPQPIDRFGRSQKEIAKTALGAQESIAWRYVEDPTEAIAAMRARGFRIVGIEQDQRAIDYRSYVEDVPTLYLMGTEVEGLSDALREQCDMLLEIPMHGTKESLNVSVAAGVVLFATLQSDRADQ